ncbi:hypothetical protein AA309_09640 [Microvirga vignae]|uniref:Uncharacterized protein n=1 Tax=Microvirga vignae TaxID=1225564 RepID=A0A0H1RDG3_9HYPH|nr:hypothetical protein AA309_09640 [Microvirga vignae]
MLARGYIHEPHANSALILVHIANLCSYRQSQFVTVERENQYELDNVTWASIDYADSDAHTANREIDNRDGHSTMKASHGQAITRMLALNLSFMRNRRHIVFLHAESAI